MQKEFNLRETESVGKEAVSDCMKFLNRQNITIEALDVQDNERYREMDVDIIWTRKNGHSRPQKVLIEVKGDRHYASGNYFFETVSNKSKETPGCFVYSRCDYLYYYFVDKKILHILKMSKIRPWFLNSMERFPNREAATPIGDGKHYITEGRLIPRIRVLEELKDAVEIYDLSRVIRNGNK